jgi:hypothetical protein
MSTSPPWIECPPNFEQRTISAEEKALRETYGLAQTIGFQLLCASTLLRQVKSPDVKACDAVLRLAFHKPEKERANALQGAQESISKRQVDYISTLAHYLEHRAAWQNIQPTLVAQLKAVLAPASEGGSATGSRLSLDLQLNCLTVANLIDECDTCVYEMSKHCYNQPTDELAKASFQKVIDALAAEVSDKGWMSNFWRALHHPGSSTDILCNISSDHVAQTSVPVEFEKCYAMNAALEQFSQIFAYGLTTECEAFDKEIRGKFNDETSESLLAVMPNLTAMAQVEQRRDNKLLAYGRALLSLRSKFEASERLFKTVARLLPEAIAEAQAIQDETMRRRAQNLCLFAARNLKVYLKYVSECMRIFPVNDPLYLDLYAALDRGHQAVTRRFGSKRTHGAEACRPGQSCTG